MIPQCEQLPTVLLSLCWWGGTWSLQSPSGWNQSQTLNISVGRKSAACWTSGGQTDTRRQHINAHAQKYDFRCPHSFGRCSLAVCNNSSCSPAAAASRSALRVITVIPTRAHRHRLTPSAHMEARSLDRRARPPRSAPLIAVLLQRGLRDQLGTPASQRQIILDIIAKGGGLKKHAAARELNLFYGASHAWTCYKSH